MEKRSDFGVLYGQKTTEDALLIYSSYEDAKASPKIGDFIVLTVNYPRLKARAYGSTEVD